MILDILMPFNQVRNFTVSGITEDGKLTEENFWDGLDSYPAELTLLIIALIETSDEGYAPGTAPRHHSTETPG